MRFEPSEGARCPAQRPRRVLSAECRVPSGGARCAAHAVRYCCVHAGACHSALGLQNARRTAVLQPLRRLGAQYSALGARSPSKRLPAERKCCSPLLASASPAAVPTCTGGVVCVLTLYCRHARHLPCLLMGSVESRAPTCERISTAGDEPANQRASAASWCLRPRRATTNTRLHL